VGGSVFPVSQYYFPRKIILADGEKHSLPPRIIILADGENSLFHLEK
jgi:hypothetical protein